MFVIIAVAVGVLFLVFSLLKKKSSIKSVPGGLPFFGHVFTMLKGSPWDTMAQWVNNHGMVFKFHLFGSDAICIADPAVLKVVLQSKLDKFQKDTEWTYKPFMVLLGQGMVTSEGENWQRQRKLLAAHLKFDILKEIPHLAVSALDRLMKRLDNASITGETIEMAEEFRHLTLQVIAELVLSISPQESDQTFAKMYLPIVTEGNLRTWHPYRMYLPTPDYFQFQKDVKNLNDYVTKVICDRRKQRRNEPGECKDLLDKILDAYTDEEWNDESICQVRDEIKTFILAGHETSASMLAWALYELALPVNEDKNRKLYEESKEILDSFLNPDGSIQNIPEKTTIDKLVYSECCLRESLRKYSNVPTVVRVAKEDVQAGEYFIQKGSTIMVSMQGVHHNPNIWPSPLEYKPERFDKPWADFTFLPFIDGPRSCLGQYLSLLESKLVLAGLTNRYKFELIDPVASGKKHPFMVPIIPETGHFMKVYIR